MYMYIQKLITRAPGALGAALPAPGDVARHRRGP